MGQNGQIDGYETRQSKRLDLDVITGRQKGNWDSVLIWLSFSSWFRIWFEKIIGCTWTLYITKSPRSTYAIFKKLKMRRWLSRNLSPKGSSSCIPLRVIFEKWFIIYVTYLLTLIVSQNHPTLVSVSPGFCFEESISSCSSSSHNDQISIASIVGFGS